MATRTSRQEPAARRWPPCAPRSELSKADEQRLAGALGKQYDTTVHLHVVVEPDLVGGLRVEIGDDVIDGSVANRLDDARRRIAG